MFVNPFYAGSFPSPAPLPKKSLSCFSKHMGLLACTISLFSSCFAESPDPAFRVVNKKVSLGTYKPNDLVKFDGIYVSKRIVKDLRKLLNDAKKAGLTLKVVSGYRSYDYQKGVFDRWVAKEKKKRPKITHEQAEKIVRSYSAVPGHSEHQLGTTVDVLSSENGYTFTYDKRYKFIDWIEQNAQKYHFKISYPAGNTEYVYEPWHLRWYPSCA